MRTFAPIFMTKTQNKAIVVGASGLIGSYLLNILLQQPNYSQVLVLVRKKLPVASPKLIQLIVDFDQPDTWADAVTGDAIFCCLGTTLKKTPDKAVYRKIDHDYPLHLAQLALKNGVKQYHLVSALGANSQSGNFYTKLKGETEYDIQQLHLPVLHIYQPSLLTGNRQEYRRAERIFIKIMKLLNPLLRGSLAKYQSIPAQTVAMAMFNQSLEDKTGVFIHPSDKIKQLA